MCIRDRELGALGPRDPGLLEEGNPVGDGLHSGEGAAPGREGLQDEEHRDRLQGVRRHQRPPRRGRPEAQRMDQTLSLIHI